MLVSTVSFEIVAEGADDEIVVKASANDPDADHFSSLEDDAKFRLVHARLLI
jgi:hypothetical protein